MNFEKALLAGNSLVLSFLKKTDVRRDVNAIEDALREAPHNHYKQPTVIPVPDEMDAQVPRIIFESTHGFSQVIISQNSISLNVKYSPEWQEDYKLGQNYIIQRAHLLFDVLNNVLDRKPLFTGLNSVVTLETVESDEEIFSHLYSHYQKSKNINNIHDFEIKTTEVVEGKYFNNIHIKNFREWSLHVPLFEGTRFKRAEACRRGIQIIGDFNDRYGFNEIDGYETDQNTYKEIIQKSFAVIQDVTEKLRGTGNE